MFSPSYLPVCLSRRINRAKGDTDAIGVAIIGRTDKTSFLADCGILGTVPPVASSGGLQVFGHQKPKSSGLFEVGEFAWQTFGSMMDQILCEPGPFKEGNAPVGNVFGLNWPYQLQLNT